MARLMMPSIAVMFFSKPIMITVEIKCGKYDMVCTTFLNGWFCTSFSKSASTMGAGKEKMKLYKLKNSVLRMMRQANAFWKNCSK